MDGLPPLLTDSLINLVSGLGTQKAKSEHGRFTYRPHLTRGEIDALYSANWIAGKLVDIPADDATREWKAWQADKVSVEAIEDAERRLKVRHHVNRALKLAAKDGGAAIILGTGDADPAKELNTAAIPRGGLRWLHTVSRHELTAGNIIRDPASPWFGQPDVWRMYAGPELGFMAIHPSRVVRFIGTPREDVFGALDPWGASIFERLHDAVRDATAALQGIASMFQEAKIDVIKVPNLTANVVRDDYRRAVLTRFGLANTLKSINNALLLDAEESWEQKALTFAGIPEVLDRLLQVVAGAADMPVTRFLGKAPAGLNATGVADLEAWYTHVRSTQETILRPTMEPLDEAIVRTAMGRKPRGITYEFRPLWSLAATEIADVRLKHAQAVKLYADTAIFEHTSLATATSTALDEDGFLPGLKAAPEPPPSQRPPEPPPAPPGHRPPAAASKPPAG